MTCKWNCIEYANNDLCYFLCVSLQNQVVADDKSPTAIPSDVQLFEAFSMQIANIVQVGFRVQYKIFLTIFTHLIHEIFLLQIRTDMPLEDTVSLQVALVNLGKSSVNFH